MLYTGDAGPCAWSFIRGELDDETVGRFLEYLRNLAKHAVPGQLVIDLCYDVPMPTPVQRKRIVEVLQSSPKLDLVAGHAFVINSTIGRGLLTAINWVVRPPFEEKVFTQPREAMDWLEERNATFDRKRLLTSIYDACPSFASLDW